MFYLRYIWSELRRRRGRTIFTALGLGVGVGLVVTVSALSSGLDQAQSKVLEPLTGVGTDMSVKRPIVVSGSGSDQSFDPSQGLSKKEQRELQRENGGGALDLSEQGKPGEHFSTTQFITTDLSFSALAPLTGIAVLPLGLAGLIVWEGPADRPEWDAAPRVILAYFGDRDTVILGSFLLMLAAVLFLWFVGSLRAVLRRAEGDVGRLSAIAYGGGLATAAFMLAMPASNVLDALYSKQLSPEGAQTFFLFGNVFLYPAAMAAAVLVAATALAALRTGALPRWLAWLSLALALWLLIPPLGSAGGTPENPAAWTGFAALDAVPLWTAVTAVVLMRKSRHR